MTRAQTDPRVPNERVQARIAKSAARHHQLIGLLKAGLVAEGLPPKAADLTAARLADFDEWCRNVSASIQRLRKGEHSRLTGAVDLSIAQATLKRNHDWYWKGVETAGRAIAPNMFPDRPRAKSTVRRLRTR
jgi:hypothetical protein